MTTIDAQSDQTTDARLEEETDRVYASLSPWLCEQVTRDEVAEHVCEYDSEIAHNDKLVQVKIVTSDEGPRELEKDVCSFLAKIAPEDVLSVKFHPVLTTEEDDYDKDVPMPGFVVTYTKARGEVLREMVEDMLRWMVESRERRRKQEEKRRMAAANSVGTRSTLKEKTTHDN